MKPKPEENNPQRESALPSAALLAVFVVNQNVSYEHEIRGIYTTLDAANALVDKLGPTSWITEHKLNAPGNGIHS